MTCNGIKENQLALGKSHQQMAAPLFEVLKLIKELGPQAGDSIFQTKILDQRFEIKVTRWMGNQESPFDHGVNSNIDVVATNLQTGKSIRFSGLLPRFIQDYGFYEGYGTKYRLDPRDIAEAFGFTR